jgi:hypothetical protein
MIDDRQVNNLVLLLDIGIDDAAWLLRSENRGLDFHTARAIAQTAAIARILRAAQGRGLSRMTLSTSELDEIMARNPIPSFWHDTDEPLF